MSQVRDTETRRGFHAIVPSFDRFGIKARGRSQAWGLDMPTLRRFAVCQKRYMPAVRTGATGGRASCTGNGGGRGDKEGYALV